MGKANNIVMWGHASSDAAAPWAGVAHRIDALAATSEKTSTVAPPFWRHITAVVGRMRKPFEASE
jgi:hypothetical protein